MQSRVPGEGRQSDGNQMAIRRRMQSRVPGEGSTDGVIAPDEGGNHIARMHPSAPDEGGNHLVRMHPSASAENPSASAENPSAHEWNIDGECARPCLHLDVRGEVDLPSEVISGHQWSSAVISCHPRSSAVISGKIDLHGERREVSDVRAIQEYGNPPLRAQRHAEEEINRRPAIKVACDVHVAMGASRVDLMRDAIIGHQRSLEVIRGSQRSSEVNRGRQRSSAVISGHQRSSEVIRGNQRSSVYQDGDTPRDRQR